MARPLAWCTATALIALGAFGLWAVVPHPASATACRCAPRPLAEYFQNAHVVMEAEVLAVEDVPVDADAPRQRRAQIRSQRDFKNAAGVGDVRMEFDVAACGPPALVPGQRYWIFGTQRPAEFDVWISACDGSRAASEGFVDVEAGDAGDALAALAKTVRCAGPTAAEIARKIRLEIEKVKPGAGALDGVRSPNGAYVFAVESPRGMERPPRIAVLTVDNERDHRLRLTLHGVAEPVHAQWVNEKVVYVRVVWSRTLRSDLLLDVEAESVIAVDSARVDPGSGALTWLDVDCTAP